jgi:uncharacterized protein YggE
MVLHTTKLSSSLVLAHLANNVHFSGKKITFPISLIYRRQASLTAVKNAKQKAGEMAQFLHAKVGQPLAVREEFCNEWEGPADGSHDSDTPITIQQRINHATMHVSVKVSATFELKCRKSKEKNSDI